MEQNVYGNLQEQVEHLQCETQASIKCDALILCQGADGIPHFTSHVTQGRFSVSEESGQLPIIMKLVIVHHFMHLLPSDISLRVEVAGCGLMFIIRNSVPYDGKVSGFSSRAPQGQCLVHHALDGDVVHGLQI